jgi:hypothetical protein
MAVQTEVLAGQVEQGFGQHPDAGIYRSQPGLGVILGARVLAEFADDPARYAHVKARKNYSGMSPITKASGTKRIVLARFARNRRLGDALFLQAFAALNNFPGARAFYDRQRARGATHYQALRAVANRLVGILHGCLRTHTLYDEHQAWHTEPDQLSARQLDRFQWWDVLVKGTLSASAAMCDGDKPSLSAGPPSPRQGRLAVLTYSGFTFDGPLPPAQDHKQWGQAVKW